jgi:hypothetical protein
MALLIGGERMAGVIKALTVPPETALGKKQDAVREDAPKSVEDNLRDHMVRAMAGYRMKTEKKLSDISVPDEKVRYTHGEL